MHNYALRCIVLHHFCSAPAFLLTQPFGGHAQVVATVEKFKPVFAPVAAISLFLFGAASAVYATYNKLGNVETELVSVKTQIAALTEATRREAQAARREAHAERKAARREAHADRQFYFGTAVPPRASSPVP